MARNFDQVLAEVTAKSDPQRNTVLNQISQLPSQQEAEESSLAAKRAQAQDDILAGARRRGLGFAGIPIGEQAKYDATDYMPAVANLKSTYANRKGTLEAALADIGRNDYMSANDIFNQDRSFEEQQRQFNESLALQRAQAAAAAKSIPAPTFGGTGGGAAQIQQRADKGFNFQDASGRPISAAQFAQQKNIPFRQLLQQMANAGDRGAAQALGFVGDDFGYNKDKVGNNQQTASLLNNLLWGVNKVNAPRAVLGTPNANRNTA